jgi:hypothetical protein
MKRLIATGVIFLGLLVCGVAYLIYQQDRTGRHYEKIDQVIKQIDPEPDRKHPVLDPQDRPTRIWLPIPTKPELLLEQRQDVVTLLTEKLSELSLLTLVSKDSGYAKDMGLATDEDGAEDLKQRLFVEIGTADSPGGKVPSINVGFICKVKEFERMKKVTNRLMTDIGIVLGLPKK